MKRAFSCVLGVAVIAAGAPSAAWAQKPIPETVRMMAPYRLRIGDYVRLYGSVVSSGQVQLVQFY